MFNINDRLGEGSFSTVYKGTNIENKNTVAIKKIRTSDIKSKIAKRLLECEVSIIKILNHPNIIQCYDVFNSANNCYIITELCNGGDLDSRLRNS
jgi:serine/threonine protein kinase